MTAASSDADGVIMGAMLVLVGAGRMGSALLGGWLERGYDPARIMVCDPAPSAAARRLVARHGIVLNPPSDALMAARPEAVVVAVKPGVEQQALPPLAPLASLADAVFLSVVTGVSSARLAAALGAPGAAIVRAMPNTPAAVGRAMTVACAGGGVSGAQRDVCQALLDAVGDVAWVDDEALLASVTALSGSGPAYVFYMAECMAQAGVRLGLAPDMAQRLARATVAGAGELLHRSAEPAATLRRNVTSPGGTTAAAMDVLSGGPGLQDMMLRAMTAACARADPRKAPGPGGQEGK